MTALPVLIIVLCVFALAYRYYSAFLASKVFALDPAAVTPAHRLRDGQNYHPMSKWVLFGHHFAAIAGAGPLVGPVLAAQFGFMPGLLWMVIGVVLGGAVHDFVVLVLSVRLNGESLVEITRAELGKTAATACAFSILFIIIVALAGFGFVVVNALAESPWGTFTITASIPIAILMGLYIFAWKKGTPGAIKAATVFGVAALVAAVIYGKWVPEVPVLSHLFPARPKKPHHRYDPLRIRGLGTSSMVTPRPARLPELLYEARHHLAPHRRHRNCEPSDRISRVFLFRKWRRTHRPWECLAFLLHHNHVWRNLRVSRTGLLRNHAQNGIQ